MYVPVSARSSYTDFKHRKLIDVNNELGQYSDGQGFKSYGHVSLFFISHFFINFLASYSFSNTNNQLIKNTIK